ncbi:hypothetical protein EXN66_Car009938 [Channa argus]|uniref:Uncharacterized protein n=1 Tax=Channa argus TaxID=215402 RepID=A0A6G1PVH0_CHAAH|nr:hypothetical protein EXN66_Car009938 [Channa argus]
MSMFQCELPLVVSVPPSVRHERREKPVLRRSSSSVSLLCRLSPVGGAQSAGDGSLEPLSGRTEPKREKGRCSCPLPAPSPPPPHYLPKRAISGGY